MPRAPVEPNCARQLEPARIALAWTFHTPMGTAIVRRVPSRGVAKYAGWGRAPELHAALASRAKRAKLAA